MTDTKPKIYGRFTVEIFDEDDGMGVDYTTFIDEDAPERYKKTVKIILNILIRKYKEFGPKDFN